MHVRYVIGDAEDVEARVAGESSVSADVGELTERAGSCGRQRAGVDLEFQLLLVDTGVVDDRQADVRPENVRGDYRGTCGEEALGLLVGRVLQRRRRQRP